MTPLPDTHHLQKRGDLYTYYRRVPTHLVPILGRKFIKKALGVSSLAEAKKLRAIEEVRANALFEAAENGSVGQGAGTAAQPVSTEMLVLHVREAVERLDKRSAERLTANPPADREELEDRREQAEMDVDRLRDPFDPDATASVQASARKLASERGLKIDDPSFPMWEFFDLMRRGLVEAGERRMDRLDGRHDRPFHDPLFNPKRAAASPTFGELCDTFIKTQMEEYEANGVSVKRADNIKAKIALLREIVGDARLVAEIDDDVVSHVRSTLAKTPNHRAIIYPKLTLAAAIDKAAKDGKSVLGPRSQGFYLDILSAVLRLGVRKKMIATNPADRVRPLVKDKVAPGDKRRSFSQDQIAKFFTSDFYRSCAPGAAAPYAKPDRSWRFWLPLIMAHSGARPSEVCTLTVADFGKTKLGTNFFAVDDEGEGKSVKTETSRRRVPIHPQLVAIGLLRFVEERRKADGDAARLFPQLSPNHYGSFIWYPSRRFNEVWLPKEMGLEPRQSLYSFRHSCRDALRRIKAGPDTLLHICGWAPAGKATSDDYGDAADPDLHAEAVAGIAYAGLDLSYLHVK